MYVGMTRAKERLILLNAEANREKELFNKNHIKPIYRIK